MSQAKVDKYKEEKKNRDAIIKKQKRNMKLGTAAFAIVCVLFVGWFGYSLVDRATRPDENAESVVTEWDVNSYMDYRSGLNTYYSTSDYGKVTGTAEETEN